MWIKLFCIKTLFINIKNKKIKKFGFFVLFKYPIDSTTLFGASSRVYLGP